jgi:uncharacterized protein
MGLGLVGCGTKASEVAGSVSTAPASGTKLPMRFLGRTGVQVSLLGFGGGTRFLMPPEQASLAMLEQAVASGITYFDTAASYGQKRRSERLFGQVLPRYRGSVFLATKTGDRTYDGALRSVEQSLRLLRTDVLDLIQIHDVGPGDDPASWEQPGGVLTALRKLKEQRVVRFVGLTGHQDAAVLKSAIERLDLDTVLMALNAARHRRFQELALPAATRRNMGVIAMKVARDLVGEGPGRAGVKDLLSHAWDLPVATAIVGMESVAMLQDNLRLLREYTAWTARTSDLGARLAREVPPEQLGWMQPGYEDRGL